MNKKQRGFGVVGIIAIVVVVALIAGVAWLAWRASNKTAANKSTNNQGTSQESPSSNTPSDVKVDNYNGWKTFSSPAEKFSFKYPSDWTVVAAEVSGNMKEQVSVRGPNKFTLTYTITKIDAKDATPADNQSTYNLNNNVYNGATPVTVPNFSKPLYIVVVQSIINGNQPVQGMGLAEYKTYVEQPLTYPMYYTAKVTSGYMVQWYGAYSAQDGGPVSMSYKDFTARAEVEKARLILQSITY